MAELNIIGAKEENRYFPYQSAFRVNRNSFWAAGQDSFTNPPAQNPDMFQSLLNVEPVTQGNLQRRRGYTLFSSQAPSSPYTEAFPFRSETLGLRSLVFTSSGNVLVINEDGSAFVPSLFVPSITASFVPKMVVSRSFGYFTDGAKSDLFKWDGTATSSSVTNWGIDINDVSSSIVGPNGPGTATNVAGTGGSASVGPTAPTSGASTGSGPAWVNPGNVTALDGMYTTSFSNSRSPVPTGTLQVTGFSTNYSAAVPTGATITGVQVTLYRSFTPFFPGSGFGQDFNVQLIVGGTASGNNYAVRSVNWPATNTPVTYGSSTDMWGLTLAPADVNSTDFGAAFQGAVFTGTLNIDYMAVTVFYTTPSGPSWTNPNNILANDGNVATVLATAVPSGYLEATNFGFSFSPAVVSGILVEVKCETASDSPNLTVQMVKDGNLYGTAKVVTVPNTTLNFISLGGSSDLWGGQFLAADVNASNFGVALSVQTNTGSVTLSADYVQITLYSGLNAISLGSPSSGNITLLNGRVYTYAFRNSLTGHVSDLGPFSLSTGPLTSNDMPLSNIPVSLDPQVDTKVILATADGGDETTLYLLATIPNSQTTYTDDTPDALTATVTSGPSLLTANIYQESDSSGNLYGVAFNVPPPLLNFPTINQGRMFGAVGQTLYYSKSLGDVTTSTGTITGKWEEAWPAVNSLDISQAAETISGLLSDGQTLYIASDTCIRRLTGTGPSNFQEPQVVFNQTGVVNQEVWKIVFAEGQPVGSIWLTPDNRVMFSDFNSYQDIGSPIQDVLSSINQSVVQTTARACFVSQQEAEYYMLYLSVNTSSLPNTVCVYNMRTKKWFIWNPTDFITACTFNYNVLGAPQWLFATGLVDEEDRAAGSIYLWDNTVNADQNNTSTPTLYAVEIQTSWLDFGDFGLTKAFNKILVTTTDPTMQITVTGAIKQADLLPGGPTILPPTMVQPEIFGEYFVPMVGAPGYYQWYQVTFVSPATSNAVNVLGAFDFEIAPSMRM